VGSRQLVQSGRQHVSSHIAQQAGSSVAKIQVRCNDSLMRSDAHEQPPRVRLHTQRTRHAVEQDRGTWHERRRFYERGLQLTDALPLDPLHVRLREGPRLRPSSPPGHRDPRNPVVVDAKHVPASERVATEPDGQRTLTAAHELGAMVVCCGRLERQVLLPESRRSHTRSVAAAADAAQ
jgi:hypothetical protein